MDKVYEVDADTKYMISLRPVKNIEDCGDLFYTEDELKDMGVRPYPWSDNVGHYLLRSKAKEELSSLLASIAKGKKSTLIKDDDLIEALKKTDTPVSDLVPGTRRVGNRLFKHTPKKKEQTQVVYKNWSVLWNVALRYIRDEYKTPLTITVSDTDRHKSVKFIKKFVTYDELKKWYDEHEKDLYFMHDMDEHWKWIKVIFDDPTTVPLPK